MNEDIGQHEQKKLIETICGQIKNLRNYDLFNLKNIVEIEYDRREKK